MQSGFIQAVIKVKLLKYIIITFKKPLTYVRGFDLFIGYVYFLAFIELVAPEAAGF